MGNLNDPPINKDSERALLEQMSEHQKAVYQLHNMGRILEAIIYPDSNNPTAILPVAADNSRVSIYQIIGQIMKRCSELLPEYNSYNKLLNVSGRMIKINGQLENELINSLNYYILEPLQKLRILDKEKIIVTNILLAQTRASLIDCPKGEEKTDEELELENKETQLNNEIKEYLNQSIHLMTNIQSNIYPMLLSQLEKFTEMRNNIQYICDLFKNDIDISEDVGKLKRDSFSIQNNVPDYRRQIYSNPLDKINYTMNWRHLLIKSENPLVILTDKEEASSAI